jgi:PKD repeat protein
VLESLSAYAGSAIQIRFRAEEIGTASTQDIAIDDVHIFETGLFNTAVVDVLNPDDGCYTALEDVTINIWSVGSNTLPAGTQIPVRYSLDGEPTVSETYTLAASVQQFDIISYTFTTQVDLTGGGIHVLKTWTSFPNDADHLNDSTTVTIDAGPLVDLGNDTLVCGGTTLFLDATSPGATYLWDNSTTTPTRTVSVDGSYHVAVTSAGCTKRDTISVNFEPIPVASFNMSHVSGLEYSFTNTSVGANTVLWKFGDGATSTDQNPTHTYASGGVQDVTLVITNPCGTDSTTQSLPVGTNEPTWGSSLTLTPNPADDVVAVSVDLQTNDLVELHVSDLAGRVLLTANLANGRCLINTETLSSGIYMLRIQAGGASTVRKLVVEH